MDYEKKYKEAFKEAEKIHKFSSDIAEIKRMEQIFPELKESEDERIRKFLIEDIKDTLSSEDFKYYNPKRTKELKEALTWLEKQGDKDKLIKELGKYKVKYTQEVLSQQLEKQQKISIWKHWKDGIAGNGDGEPIYLIKCGSTYSISSCLGCECDYIELSELDKLLSEKQGEQKFDYTTLVETGNGGINALVTRELPTNKPKFKVGDWIVNNQTSGIFLVKEVGDSEYCLWPLDGIIQGYLRIIDVDTEYRLWTIQDAKDGDVLCCESGWTCIFKSLNSDNISFSSYCFMDNTGWFCETGSESHTLEKAFIKAYNGEIYPATKEQRDLLFQKMKEAGYEWDAEKKELKKINNALEECEIEHIEHGKYYYCIKDYYSGGCKRVSKGEVVQALRGMSIMALGVKANEYFIPVKRIVDVSPAWSEEDKKWINSLIETFKDSYFVGFDQLKSYGAIDWLKSLERRISCD